MTGVDPEVAFWQAHPDEPPVGQVTAPLRWPHLDDDALAVLLLRMTGATAPRSSAAYKRDLAREVARRLRARARGTR